MMMPQADRDPILLAGVARCPRCGRVAFPTDAAWLDAASILVTYAPPCGHLRGPTIMLDARDLVLPGFDWSRYVSGRRCAGRNRRGRPCGSYAAAGSDYCRTHGAVPPPKGSLP